jgi:hypothetical protein
LIAFLKDSIDVKLAPFNAFLVNMPKKTSTRFIQLAEVGV